MWCVCSESVGCMGSVVLVCHCWCSRSFDFLSCRGMFILIWACNAVLAPTCLSWNRKTDCPFPKVRLISSHDLNFILGPMQHFLSSLFSFACLGFALTDCSIHNQSLRVWRLRNKWKHLTNLVLLPDMSKLLTTKGNRKQETHTVLATQTFDNLHCWTRL